MCFSFFFLRWVICRHAIKHLLQRWQTRVTLQTAFLHRSSCISYLFFHQLPVVIFLPRLDSRQQPFTALTVQNWSAIESVLFRILIMSFETPAQSCFGAASQQVAMCQGLCETGRMLCFQFWHKDAFLNLSAGTPVSQRWGDCANSQLPHAAKCNKS